MKPDVGVIKRFAYVPNVHGAASTRSCWDGEEVQIVIDVVIGSRKVGGRENDVLHQVHECFVAKNGVGSGCMECQSGDLEKGKG